MTKSGLIELIEEYGQERFEQGDNSARDGCHLVERSSRTAALSLFSEIREKIKALESELDDMRADTVLLDSGCIVTIERNEFGEEYSCERVGMNLRAAIDAAIQISKCND